MSTDQIDAPARPRGVTPYMWGQFLRAFQHGCRFWTSEDGDAMDLVIMRRPDALDVLRREFDHLHVAWQQIQLREAYVERAWVGADYFDGPGFPGKQRRGRVWQFVDAPTPFAVYRWCPDARA